jgi:hypothetical protein
VLEEGDALEVASEPDQAEKLELADERAQDEKPRPRRQRRGLLLGALAFVLLALIAALVAIVVHRPSRNDALVTDPNEIASCLDRGGAVFTEFGDGSDAVTLGVDLAGRTSNAPGLYLYVAGTDEASRKVLERLQEIADSTDVDVEDRGRVLLAYLSQPTGEERAMVNECLGT